MPPSTRGKVEAEFKEGGPVRYFGEGLRILSASSEAPSTAKRMGERISAGSEGPRRFSRGLVVLRVGALLDYSVDREDATTVSSAGGLGRKLLRAPCPQKGEPPDRAAQLPAASM
jgi:hypothetical protein